MSNIVLLNGCFCKVNAIFVVMLLLFVVGCGRVAYINNNLNEYQIDCDSATTITIHTHNRIYEDIEFYPPFKRYSSWIWAQSDEILTLWVNGKIYMQARTVYHYN